MKLNKLDRIGNAIIDIQESTDTEFDEIVDALIGVAFDEEDAGEIKFWASE